MMLHNNYYAMSKEDKNLLVLSLYIKDCSNEYLQTIITYQGRSDLNIKLINCLDSLQLTKDFTYLVSGYHIKPSDRTSIKHHIENYRGKL